MGMRAASLSRCSGARRLASGGRWDDGVDDGFDDDFVADHERVEEAVDLSVVGFGQDGAFWGDNEEVGGGPERGGGDGEFGVPVIVQVFEEGASWGHLAGGFCGVEGGGSGSVVGA